MSILRFREKLNVFFNLKDPPLSIALAFGAGIFIGISPLIGFHTIIGIIVSYIFKLNRFVTIMGVYITNPWTIVPIYTFSIWVGVKVTGVKIAFSDISWNNITLFNLVKELKILLFPFIFGTLFVGLFAGLAGFLLVYYSVSKVNKDKKISI